MGFIYNINKLTDVRKSRGQFVILKVLAYYVRRHVEIILQKNVSTDK